MAYLWSIYEHHHITNGDVGRTVFYLDHQRPDGDCAQIISDVLRFQIGRYVRSKQRFPGSRITFEIVSASTGLQNQSMLESDQLYTVLWIFNHLFLRIRHGGGVEPAGRFLPVLIFHGSAR